MLDSLLQNIRSDNFAALKGTIVTGRVPVREALLNELLETVRLERDLPTRRLEIRLNAGNEFTLILQPQFGFLTPTVKLDFEITPEVDFQEEGRLTIRSLGALGAPTAQLVRTVLLRALKLPGDYVIVEGKNIHLRLRDTLQVRGSADIAAIIRSLRLSTVQGRLSIVFNIFI